MALPVLKTPAEFIDFYFNTLKNQLSSNNFKLNKTGFIGFILNVLGNTQFDIKQYYDGLFNESFPITALDDLNLQFHANLHNYKFEFATPATITDGVFSFNLDVLPNINPGLQSRIISFGASSAVVGSVLPIGIDHNSISFVLNSIYNISARVLNGVVVSYDSEIISPLNQKNITMPLTNPILPIVSASQFTITSFANTIPYYIPGVHYNLTIPLNVTDMLGSLSATVLDSQTNVLTTFVLSNDKSIYGPKDNVIFYKMAPNNVLLLELGSGVNGSYISAGSVLNIVVHLTKGSLGNIMPSDTVPSTISKLSDFTQSAIVTDTYSTGVVSTALDITKIITPKINTATGGLDILLGDNLRQSLIKYIQSKDFLISQLDYTNYVSALFNDHYVSFSKTLLASNTMNLFLSLVDRYDIPYQTTTLTVSKQLFETDMYTDTLNGVSVVYNPTALYNTKTFISPFYYKYNPLFRSYQGYTLTNNSDFHYSTVTSKDSNNVPIVNNIPYVFINLNYHHNSIAPFTIISLGSFEDISLYTVLPASVSVNIASPNISLVSNTVNHILPVSKKSGMMTSLTLALAAADITISVNDVSVFPINGTLLIGTEEIIYTGRNLITNLFTGLTRGVNGTTAAVHAILDIVDDLTTSNSTIDFFFGVISSTLTSPVLIADVTLTVSDTTYFPSTGTVGIDSEEMTYTGKTPTTLIGLTRGANATVAAVHNVNVGVFEKLTSTAALSNPDLFLGVVPNATQINVVLDNIVGLTGANNSYVFDISQLIDISDFLFIKDYIIPDTGTVISITLAVTISDTIFTLSNTGGFSATGGFAKIGQEYIFYASKTITTLTGVVRAKNGSIAVSHGSGSPILPVNIDELNVPAIDNTQYIVDTTFIQSQIKTKLSNLTIPVNRSISDDIQVRLLNTSSISLTDARQIVWNGSSYTSAITLPLKISVSMLLNNNSITSLSANVINDIETLKLTISQALITKYTGVKIRVSDADIVLLAKQLKYVDDANVTFTDSSVVPISIPLNEINVKDDNVILKSMTKSQRLNYIPPLWYWDINNITIVYTVQ